MRIIVRPVSDPRRELDLTHRLVAAIAEELWRLYGVREQLNWLEAEMHLQRIVGEARAEAQETIVAVVPAAPTTEAVDGIGGAERGGRSGLRQRIRRRSRGGRRSPQTLSGA